MNSEWQKELLNNAVSPDEVAGLLRLSPDEVRAMEAVTGVFPMSVPRYYLSIIDPNDPDDPIRRLAIPEEGRAAMEADMRAIVDFAGELSELDTSGVPIMANASRLESVLRDDVAERWEGSREMIEAAAPAQYEGMPIVPRTFA